MKETELMAKAKELAEKEMEIVAKEKEMAKKGQEIAEKEMALKAELAKGRPVVGLQVYIHHLAFETLH